MSDAALLIEAITTGPFAENCYIVAEAASRRGVLIDPGDEPEHILGRVRELDLTIERIVNTHAHIDHIGAVAPLKRMLGVPFSLHPNEVPVLESAPMVARMFGLTAPEVPEVDEPLAAGATLHVGGLSLEVRETPGHSPGGVCFFAEQAAALFVGDTLFQGSIGRTDLPGGDLESLLRSIQSQILTLSDDVGVYPGHGPATTVGAERRGNPFLQPGFHAAQGLSI